MSNQVDLMESLNLAKIRASSRKAAWGSLVGGVVVVTAIVFSVIRLRMLDQEVATRTGELTNLNDQITGLEKKIEPLTLANKQLEGQINHRKVELERVKADLAKAQSDRKIAEEQKQLAEKGKLLEKKRRDSDYEQLGVSRNNLSNSNKVVSDYFTRLKDMGFGKDPVDLLRVGVVPKASVGPVTGEAAPNVVEQKPPDSGKAKGKQIYSLWITYRDKQVEQSAAEHLKSVIYTLNHVSFNKDGKKRQLIPVDPANGYRVEYVGWGAVTNVIIELHLRGGEVVKLDFDMHAALPSRIEAVRD